MRKYFFILVDDVNQLNQLPNCLYTEDRQDGNGPELLFDGATLETAGTDYPEKIALVRVVPDTRYFQICPLSNNPDVGDRLFGIVKENGEKLGLTVYETAKDLSIADTTMADGKLYMQRAVLDKDGKLTGKTERVTGSKLMLNCCLVGDDAEKCADPASVVEVVKEGEKEEEIKNILP
jgi:hypothetical protein